MNKISKIILCLFFTVFFDLIVINYIYYCLNHREDRSAGLRNDGEINKESDLNYIGLRNIINEAKYDGNNIRVLIKTSDYKDIFHSDIEFGVDNKDSTSYEIILPDSCIEDLEKFQEEACSFNNIKGSFCDGKCYLYLTYDRYNECIDGVPIGAVIHITQKGKAAGIVFNSIKRNGEIPKYEGDFYVLISEEGFIVINDIPFEEYLKYVVPSEMPSGYCIESLKAQAICARTYAYKFINMPAYENLGANLDDSVSFQVYNGICRQDSTDLAVELTKGKVLFDSNDCIAEIYYFSTSCGSRDKDIKFDDFEVFISSANYNCLEKEEPWFRWTYKCSEIDVSSLKSKMNSLINKNGCVEALENDNFSKVGEGKGIVFSRIKDIIVSARRFDGRVESIDIKTNNGVYRINGEYNIRNCLLSEEASLMRNDGISVGTLNLLPSAYFKVCTNKKNSEVLSYSLYGGGFGHGDGMSQNGAFELAKRGLLCDEILKYYFEQYKLGYIDE